MLQVFRCVFSSGEAICVTLVVLSRFPSPAQLTRKRADLKKKLKVTFVGEAGLDMGGLTKEWFLLLIRQIFHTDYGETSVINTGQVQSGRGFIYDTNKT